MAQMVNNLPAMQETRVNPWVGKIPWRRKGQPTAVFLPGEFHEQRSLVGYSPWGCKGLDTTEGKIFSLFMNIIQVIANLMGYPDISVGKESTCNTGDPGSIPGSQRSTGEGIGYPLQYSWTSMVVQLVKNLLKNLPACNVGDLGLISRLERSSAEGKGYPFQYSGPENSMNCIMVSQRVGHE